MAIDSDISTTDIPPPAEPPSVDATPTYDALVDESGVDPRAGAGPEGGEPDAEVPDPGVPEPVDGTPTYDSVVAAYGDPLAERGLEGGEPDAEVPDPGVPEPVDGTPTYDSVVAAYGDPLASVGPEGMEPDAKFADAWAPEPVVGTAIYDRLVDETRIDLPEGEGQDSTDIGRDLVGNALADFYLASNDAIQTADTELFADGALPKDSRPGLKRLAESLPAYDQRESDNQVEQPVDDERKGSEYDVVVQATASSEGGNDVQDNSNTGDAERSEDSDGSQDERTKNADSKLRNTSSGRTATYHMSYTTNGPADQSDDEPVNGRWVRVEPGEDETDWEPLTISVPGHKVPETVTEAQDERRNLLERGPVAADNLATTTQNLNDLHANLIDPGNPDATVGAAAITLAASLHLAKRAWVARRASNDDVE